MAGEEKMEKLPPILRLPSSVRHRIYHFVGLASSSERPYRFDLHGGTISQDMARPSNFHGLLQSCRVIYAESATLLYSANKFVICYDPSRPDPLQPLRALTASSLASLRSLNIILNQASCHQHYDASYNSDYESGNYRYCCMESGARCEGFLGSYCELFHSSWHQLPLLTRSPGSRSNSGPGDDDDELAAAEFYWPSGTWRLLASPASLVGGSSSAWFATSTLAMSGRSRLPCG